MNVYLQNQWCRRFLTDVTELFPSTAAFVERSMSILAVKGPDYAPENVALLDVHYIAWATRTTPEQVLYVLVTKQWTAVRRFVAMGRLESESIHSRLNDVANYAALLDFLITNRLDIVTAILAPNSNLLPCTREVICYPMVAADRSRYCENCQFLEWLTARRHNVAGNTSGS